MANNLRNIRGDPPQLPRPQRDDTYLTHFAFDYLADSSVTALTVITADPHGVLKEITYTAPQLKRFGIEGPNGHGHYHVSFSSADPLGVYKYRFWFSTPDGLRSNEASTSVELLERGPPRLKIADINPKAVQPGTLLTVTGTGFDSSSIQENIVAIAGRAASVKEVASDRLLVQVPERVSNGPLALFNRNGLTYSDANVEIVQGHPANGRPSLAGGLYWSTEEDLSCVQTFGPDPGSATPTHVISPAPMVVGTSLDLIWCIYVPPTVPYGTYSWISTNPNVLTVSPNIAAAFPGIWAIHLQYTARNVGTATVVGSSGSSHMVQVVAALPSPPPPPPPPPPPQPSIAAPIGRFIIAPGPVSGIAVTVRLTAEWQIAAGAGSASVSVAVSDPNALELLSPDLQAVGEGLSTIEVLLRSRVIGDPSTDVVIAMTATNTNGGLTSHIQTIIVVRRIPDLAINGLTYGSHTISFGSVLRGQTATRELVLSAVGGRAAAFGRIEDLAGVVLIQGPTTSPWRVRVATPGPGGNCQLSEYGLTQGQSCVYTIDFTPTAPQHIRQHEPVLIFRGNQSNGPEISVTLLAVGIPMPELTVQGVRDDAVEFGAVAATDTVYKDIALENGGDTGSVLTGSVTLGAGSGVFAIPQGGGAFSLAAGQRKTITLAMVQPSPTHHTNLLNITSNDPNTPARRIALSGDNVRVRVWSRVFIPFPWLQNPASSECFGGDNRGFQPFEGTSRLEQVLEFDLGNGTVFEAEGQPGTTYRVNCAAARLFHDRGYPLIHLDSATANKSCLWQTVSMVSDTWVLARFFASCYNPLAPLTAPAIDLLFNVFVNRYTRQWAIGGAHDGFPAYEVYLSINSGEPLLIHSYMPQSVADALKLFDPLDIVLPTPFLEEHNRRLSDIEDGGILPAGVP